jgi:hypothetical protein
MTIKYGTDEFGNVWNTFAQTEPVGGTVCYNPETETLEEPPIVTENKRLIVENGKWKQIVINSEHIKDGEKIRPKNQVERMRDGLDEIPKGMKILGDGNTGEIFLVSKTLEEQLKTNEITQGQYNSFKNITPIMELENIDAKSIRSLREWLIKQDDCPEFLKQHDKEATAKRSELLK